MDFLKLIVGRGKTLIGILCIIAPHIARLFGKPVPVEADEVFYWLGALVVGVGTAAKVDRWRKNLLVDISEIKLKQPPNKKP